MHPKQIVVPALFAQPVAIQPGEVMRFVAADARAAVVRMDGGRVVVDRGATLKVSVAR